MRTTLRINESLLQKAKEAAAAQNLSLTAFVEEGLRLLLTEAPSVAKIVLPVSGKGGLVEGVAFNPLQARWKCDRGEGGAVMESARADGREAGGGEVGGRDGASAEGMAFDALQTRWEGHRGEGRAVLESVSADA